MRTTTQLITDCCDAVRSPYNWWISDVLGRQRGLLDPTCSIVVIWVNIFQTELMVKICAKSLVRAIDKVLLIKFS